MCPYLLQFLCMYSLKLIQISSSISIILYRSHEFLLFVSSNEKFTLPPPLLLLLFLFLLLPNQENGDEDCSPTISYQRVTQMSSQYDQYNASQYTLSLVWSMTRQNGEVVDFIRSRVKNNSKLTNLMKISRIEGYNGK